MLSLAFDAVSGTLYGIGDDSLLYEVNRYTAAATYIGPVAIQT